MNEQPSSEKRFNVGDVVVFLPAPDGNWPEYDNTEGTIVSGPAWHECDDKYGYEVIYAYEVRAALDGNLVYCEPSYLRKKRPPREDLQVVRWDQCPWQPQQARA